MKTAYILSGVLFTLPSVFNLMTTYWYGFTIPLDKYILLQIVSAFVGFLVIIIVAIEKNY